MNILFLSELFYPHGSGAETATYLYARLLSESEFNVVVVTNQFPGEPNVSTDNGFRVYRLPITRTEDGMKYAVLSRVDILCSSTIAELIKWSDVVYVPRFWYSAIPLVRTYGKPLILHLHDYVPVCPLSNLFQIETGATCDRKLGCSSSCIYTFERQRGNLTRTLISLSVNLTVWNAVKRLILLSNAIICVSEAQRNIVVKYYPSISTLTRVIYNPIHSSHLSELTGDDFGYFGGSSYLKGFNTLLKALRYNMIERSMSVNIHATKLSNVTEDCLREYKKLGLLPYPKLNPHEYRKTYSMIKAVLVPSLWDEPLPYVVMEALNNGRLVLASSTGGIPEMTSGCKGVFLHPPGDSRRLADDIESASSLVGESLLDISAHNKEIFSKRYDNERTKQAFTRLVDQVLHETD